MHRGPVSVLIVGAFFIAAGVLGIAYHATELTTHAPFDVEVTWALVVRLLAVVGGVFLIRGANWARWLVLGWMAYHLVLSTLHSVSQVVMHAVILVIVAYVLLRPAASGYFRTTKPPVA